MNRIVILLVAMIVIITLALTGLIIFSIDLLSENGEDPVALEVGNYAVYNSTNHMANESDTEWIYTMKFEIAAINDTHYLINITEYGPGIPNWTCTYNTSWEKDWVFAGGFLSSSFVNFSKVDTTYVNTNWGLLNCEYYIGNWTKYTFDVFIINGILVKQVTTIHGCEGTQFNVLMLTDTNIREISDPK